MIVQDLSTVEYLPGDGFKHDQKFICDIGPESAYVTLLRKNNELRQRGWSDQRLMKFNASIPAELVWYYENVLGWNLADRKDYQKFLERYPQFVISPVDSGRSGRIIVKGD